MSVRALAMSPKKWEPVFGSNDLAIKKAQVAQLVEHATENRSVGGSIPPLGTISRSFAPQSGQTQSLHKIAKSSCHRGLSSFLENTRLIALFDHDKALFRHKRGLIKGCISSLAMAPSTPKAQVDQERQHLLPP